MTLLTASLQTMSDKCYLCHSFGEHCTAQLTQWHLLPWVADTRKLYVAGHSLHVSCSCLAAVTQVCVSF